MLIIERVVALSAAAVFSELPDHILAQVAAVVDEVSAEPGDVVIHEGRTESWMYVLVEGEATVTVAETPVAVVNAGEVIGELAAFDPEPRSATVTASKPCLLFRLEHSAMQEVMFDQPDLALAVITMLVRRLRATNQAMNQAENGMSASTGTEDTGTEDSRTGETGNEDT